MKNPHLMAFVLACVLLLSACGFGNAPQPTPSRPVAAPSPTSTSCGCSAFPAATSTPDKLAAKLTEIARKPTDTPAPPAVGTSTTASPEALAYLAAAIDYIQANSIMRDKVDWPKIRRVALGPGQNAQAPRDTYAAIEYVLAQLGDNHSQFFTPEEATQMANVYSHYLGMYAGYSNKTVDVVDTGGPAKEAGVTQGDDVRAINGTPAGDMSASEFYRVLYEGNGVSFTLARAGSPVLVTADVRYDFVNLVVVPRGRLIGGKIGYISVPPTTGVVPHVAGISQEIIRDVDKQGTCGWVVDLQGNTGGSIWPMVAGVAPILGEGEFGSWMSPSGPVSWREVMNTSMFVANPYTLTSPMPPVALLIDSGTASAGEAVVVAFTGRRLTRTFGEATAGVPTANEGKQLKDGALILLTIAEDVDRTGKVYNASIPPDQPVTPDATLRGTDNDPVLKAAVKWLGQQPGCAAK